MELCIDRITKHYKNKIAVDRVSLKMNKGVYGLLGANGAGKTTLMRMICGVLKATSGSISFNNLEVSAEGYREVLGYLPQDFGYYPEFTVYDFMMYMASLKGLTKKQGKLKTKELLELVTLSDVSKKKIKTLSGGMKQRLGIAQSLLNDPKILVLDEPTSGLDPKERIKFRNLISSLGENRIVLLSTHIVSDVEHIAHKIIIMKDGQVLQEGTRQEIISLINDKVYEICVDADEAKSVIGKGPLVNMRSENEKVVLRMVCEKMPHQLAVKKEASLEDLYLYYFKEGEKYV